MSNYAGANSVVFGRSGELGGRGRVANEHASGYYSTMKHFIRVALLLCLALAPTARGQGGADDQYLGIYYLIVAGDSLSAKEQFADALAKYTEAQNDLKKFQTEHPDWNENVVSFRLNYLQEKIAAVTPKLPPPAALPKEPPPAAPVVAVSTAPPAPSNSPVVVPPMLPFPVVETAPATNPPVVTAPVVIAPKVEPLPAVTPTAVQPPPDFEKTVGDLQNQLRQAMADKAVLEAKLREALSVKPAAADPQELNRAQEEIRELQKENALFQTSLEQVRAKHAQAEIETAANEALRHELTDAQQKADELSHANADLMAENTKLGAQLQQPVSASAASKALRDENAVLKKKVAELSKNSPAPDADLAGKLHETQAQVAAMQSDLDLLRLEKTALQDRVKAMSAATPAGGNANAERIKTLEAERDGLQQRLDAALSQIAAGKTSRDNAAEVDQTSRALADLRARMGVLEAHPVPYTPDELALMSRPGTTLLAAAAHSSGRKSPGELPAKAAALLSEAKRDVANHDLDQAELKYLDILKYDEKNIATLADLASIQVDLDHLGDADQHIAAALAIEPDNEYSLFVLGRLRFKQQKFDDAFDALSRAAQLNPDNAEIQNYLGITLSEKGLRGPAEAALRKAVQIDPGYASAHVNLAFIYITQQPPLAELARWHYEKALAAGYAPNLAIEKLLAAPKVPPGAP